MSDASLIEIECCQLCGSTEHTLKFAEDPYRVLECSNCGLVYVTPRFDPDALRKVYSETYWKSDKPREQGYADYAADEALYLKTFRRRIGFLSPLGPGPLRVLDVGCAAGFFLRVMKEKGHDVAGVELSGEIAQNAIKHLGADRVHIGTLDSVPDGHQHIRAGGSRQEPCTEPQNEAEGNE